MARRGASSEPACPRCGAPARSQNVDRLARVVKAGLERSPLQVESSVRAALEFERNLELRAIVAGAGDFGVEGVPVASILDALREIVRKVLEAHPIRTPIGPLERSRLAAIGLRDIGGNTACQLDAQEFELSSFGRDGAARANHHAACGRKPLFLDLLAALLYAPMAAHPARHVDGRGSGSWECGTRAYEGEKRDQRGRVHVDSERWVGWCVESADANPRFIEQTRMEYVEFEVVPSLRQYVQCVWRLRDADSVGAQTIYPDGRCELIVHLGEPMRLYSLAHGWQRQARCLFAAQLRAAIRLEASGPVDCIGVRLLPAASAAIAGQRLPALADEIIDLERLDAGFATRLVPACTAMVESANLERLWRLLESRVASHPLDLRIASAVVALDAAQGRTPIAALARAQAMSLRSLQMRFLECVGLTAKEYARVQRLQATIRQLDGAVESLSQMAVDAGFADQAHATREVQRLTGLTPARLRRALAAERNGDATLRLAAAFVRGSRAPTRPAQERLANG